MALKLPLARNHSDEFQTPAWCLEPLFRYISPLCPVWEPAAGKGNIVRAFEARGYTVLASDVNVQERPGVYRADFLADRMHNHAFIVTNPPYTLKDQFLARCYELRQPFALLMPLTALEGQKRMALYRTHGMQLLCLPRRVNFETPGGYTETTKKKSSAHFASAWFTWGLGLRSDVTFWEGPK